MLITIEYDSIWQNSFLSSESDRPFSKDNRGKFNASSKAKEHVSKKITNNTVLGILCRLIGDQRKLYQAIDDWNINLPFKRDDVSYTDHEEISTDEIAFIVNKGDNRPAQSKFLGVIPDDTGLFYSETAPQLWSVLYFKIDDLIDFISSNKASKQIGSSMPRDILFRVNDITNIKLETGMPLQTIEKSIEDLKVGIKKEKDRYEKRKEKYSESSQPNDSQVQNFEKVSKQFYELVNNLENKITALVSNEERKQFDKKIKDVVDYLGKSFPNESYLENGSVLRMRLYAAALYIQAERMISEGISLEFCKKTNGQIAIQGFSKRGFNSIRDFLHRFAGSKKKTIGTPFPLTKACGRLEININIERDKAKKLKQLIENARVSSFYLGKKGLAYVTDIDTREVRH